MENRIEVTRNNYKLMCQAFDTWNKLRAYRNSIKDTLGSEYERAFKATNRALVRADRRVRTHSEYLNQIAN